MKTYLKFLERWAFELAVLLGTCPYAPPFIQKNVGHEAAVVYCLGILVMSAAVLLPCVIWLKSDHLSNNPGSLMMLTAGGVLGIMISVSALGALLTLVSPHYYFWWREWPSVFLAGMMLLGTFFHFTLPRGNVK